VTLAELIARLDLAGFDLDAEQLLDAFWLASLRRDLSIDGAAGLGERVAGAEAGGVPRPRSDARSALQRRAKPPRDPHVAVPAAARTVAQATLRPTSASVFARAEVLSSEAHMNAAPVPLPAPRILPDRLALMRALRPLMQRWPSSQTIEVDEDSTVDQIARAGARQPIAPVFRARGERWFEVDLVLEDDASVELWADTLRAFAGVLRDGGMFRMVSVWRLRTRNLPAHDAYLESAGGARISTTALLGKAARRLIIFASNGASARWSDGRYSEVLGPWIRDNAVLLLQLTAPSRWARSRLGEPHGLAKATVAGAPGIALRVDGDWWRMPHSEADEAMAPLPVVDLSPSSLAQWASMQMARGRAQPAYLLRLSRPGYRAPAAIPDAQRSQVLPIERIIGALQYESAESVRLATLLSHAPFTVSVARLVQAIEFKGNTDPTMLAELMRSGIVVDVSRPSGSDATMAATYFRVRPEAAEHLLRGLRRFEAAEVARELQRRVSAHLAGLSGSTARSVELIADEAGRQRLPAWAQPFAQLAMSLLGLPDTPQATTARFQRCLESFPREAVRAIADMAAQDRLRPDRLAPALWQRLSAYGLIYQSVDGTWRFAPGARELFGGRQPTPAPVADEAHAVVVALDLLQSMALAFHIGQLPGAASGPYGIAKALPHWTKQRAAALAHWTSMAEYVFIWPVTHALATGQDPVADGHDDADIEAVRELLNACEEAMADGQQHSRQTSGLARLRLALRLLKRRQAELFEDLLIPFIEDEVRRFLDETSPSDDEVRWDEDTLTAIRWLRNDDVTQAVAPYTRAFFQSFDGCEGTDLALSPDYPAYLEALIDIWREAAQELLTSNADPSTRLELSFPVDTDSIQWARTNLPGIGVRESDGRSGAVWSVPASDYLELIDELAAIVIPATGRRIARGRWRPKVVWLADRSKNNAVDGEQILRKFAVDCSMASSKEEALLLCKATLCDAVIADVAPPDDPRARYTLIDRLRSQQNTVPFVLYGREQLSQYPAPQLNGAIGAAADMEQLSRFLLEAFLRYDDALARPFSPDLLLAYTERRFPGQGTEALTNWIICRDIDEAEFATLLDIDRAMDAVAGALAALLRERGGPLQSGSDCLAIALCLASRQFRRVYPLPEDVADSVARHAPHRDRVTVPPADRASHDDDAEDESDKTALQLARRLSELVTQGQTPLLEKQLAHALESAIDNGDWLVEADSYMSVESDDTYGRLDSWRFAEPGPTMFEPYAYEAGTMSVTVRITLVIEVHSSFNFSVKDWIDKDQVSMGHTESNRRVSTTVDVDMEVTGVEDGEPRADTIDVEAIAMQVEFGHVQPDEWEADDD
jgi:hypothetical protein